MSPSTYKNTIIAIILLLITSIGFGLLVQQTYSQGEKLEEQVATLQTQRAQEESFFRLQRIAEETQEERLQLESYFLLKESDSIDFLNNIESIAPQAGVVLQTSSLDTVVDSSDNSQWIEVDFSFSGSRSRVREFVEVLEELPYVSRMMSLNVTMQNQGQWQAEVTMRVRVLAYDS